MRRSTPKPDQHETGFQSALHTLSGMTNVQLRAIWLEHKIRGEPPHFKQGLVRGIAWHLQAPTHGRLDADTRRLLKSAIRNAPLPGAGHTRATARKKRDPLILPAGTTLVRSWRGRKHEVHVIEDGKRFKYRDTEYASLSEIARDITGARWSGPRFFGLKKLKQPA
jgi:Protein of unknown function (DUF2924)